MAADNALGPAQDSHHLVHSLARLSTSDLVRFTLQKPDVARVFAASLHQLAVEAASSPLPNVNEQQLGKSHVDILARLIERGDPSLARKFVPTQGSLVDLAVAAPADTTAAVAAILERLLDATSVKEIVSGLSAQFSGLVSTQDQQDAATLPSVIRTLARLSSAFLRVCPARLLKGNVALLQPWARTCVQIYDKILPQVARTLSRDGTTILSEPDSLNLEAQEWQLHWLTCRVDLLQLVSILLEYLRGSSKLVDASRESLADTEMLLKKGGFSTLLNSTVLLDLAATSESWPSLRSELSSSVTSKKGHNNGTIASVDTLATLVPKFTGAAWDALQRYVASQAPSPAKEIQEPAASSISEDVLASVDSILPHYGMDRLRVILSRPSFAGQNAELVIQRLLEGDEGESDPSSSTIAQPHAAAPPTPAAPSQQPAPIALPSPAPHSSSAAPSLVKSRANLFGDFAFDPSTIVQPKLARSGKVDELAPELKAAIIARAEAADEEEAGEEWNPFAPARTVGVEDELDLDNDGRERTAPRRTTDDDEEDDEEEEARMRERVLLRHYVQHGSSAFSADASTRRSDGRQRLKQEAGMSDDLIESWAVMLDRNPRKDRLLAAASQSALDDQLASRISRNVSEAEDDDDGSQQRQWGPDRGRGGRILRGASRGGRGGGGRGGSASGGGGSGSGQSKNATRGRGTGNSGTDRSAKQKEKAGNKARQRGHDKKMARVNP
ncbi:hypothetical protein PSEUBRA_004960 [Kalmanozyma brasiliensis GHG001]|uniref:uncharacterized protein n=1 Tax=Kalmanozyma brasiliensis (strain GHG001) TaxID=1365824 RepID=UPI002867B51E|nr:uncharacterized protein PSEUBRA_004960 [Kalmanozyma brasiliensis GHG001]EST05913.2 hypothetical protein PSEUBRA_004960 [Kalmanozyma brasiliensis GHG001]